LSHHRLTARWIASAAATMASDDSSKRAGSSRLRRAAALVARAAPSGLAENFTTVSPFAGLM